MQVSVARVTEISSASPDGFEAAIREGIERANKTLRNVQGAWVKDMNVFIEDNQIQAYKVKPGGHLRTGGTGLGSVDCLVRGTASQR